MEEWKYQVAHAIKTSSQLSEYVDLSEKEKEDIDKVIGVYKMSITPYYAGLMDKFDHNCPIRKMIIPSLLEFNGDFSPNIEKENSYEEVPGFRQEYKDKCTILLTYVCPNYCRYCFRKFWVGKNNRTLSNAQIDAIIDRILNDENIQEVCISGGEPLVVDDEKIKYLLDKIKSIDHVKVVRLFTRSLVFMPQRITQNLVETLRLYPTLYVCTHFNHPKEITEEAEMACKRLIENGIPVLNQSVLLKGVNDSTEVMRQLLWKLIQIKVKPFYLYHCINTTGTHYLVTKLSVGTEIIRDLYCHMSALAIPLYIAPLYDGKVLLMPDYYKTDDAGKQYFESQTGERFYIEELE